MEEAASMKLKHSILGLLFILNREYQLVELKASIQMKTHEDINQQQKEYSRIRSPRRLPASL